MAVTITRGINYENVTTGSMSGKCINITGSRDDYYVECYNVTDAEYTIPATSSIFIADLNLKGSGAEYTYASTASLSGSVSNLQTGSYTDYYVMYWWAARQDIWYTFDPPTGSLINANGQFTSADIFFRTWPGYKIVTMHKKANNKLVGLVGVYPYGSTDKSASYISPGVDGYFVIKSSGAGLSTDLGAGGVGAHKLGKLKLVSNDYIVATTDDPAPNGLLDDLSAHWDLDEETGIRYSHNSQSNFIYNTSLPSSTPKLGTRSAHFTRQTGSVLNCRNNSYVSIGNNQSFTIGLWLYFKSGSFVDQDIIYKGGNNSNVDSREYGAYYYNKNITCYMSNGSMATVRQHNLPYTYNTWQYLMMWYDHYAGTFNATLDNGSVYSSASVGSYSNTGSLVLGGNNDSGSAFLFTGSIDSVDIWKRALSDTERAWLWNSGSGLEFSQYEFGPFVQPTIGFYRGMTGFFFP